MFDITISFTTVISTFLAHKLLPPVNNQPRMRNVLHLFHSRQLHTARHVGAIFFFLENFLPRNRANGNYKEAYVMISRRLA